MTSLRVSNTLPKPSCVWPRFFLLLPFLLFAAGYFIAPRIAGATQLTTLIFIGINVLLALGLNLLMGYAGQISLGHAAFFGMGAYTSAILTVRPIPAPIIPGMSLGIGVMAGAACLISLTRLSGGRLAAGCFLLLVLALTAGKLPTNQVLSSAGLVVLMGLIGLLIRSQWLSFAIAGLACSVVWSVSRVFLAANLARGGASPWVGILVGVGITSLVAYLIGGQVLRLKGHYLAMATLAFGIIVEIVFRQWTDVFGGSSDGIFGIPTINFADGSPGFVRWLMRLSVGGPVDERQQYFFLVWGLVFLSLILANNIVRSRVGRAFRAVHGSEVAAESLGVDTGRYKVQVFVLSAAMASVAGSLYAHNAGIGYINPGEFSFMVSVQLVVMVVVGGMASVWGALFGATVIQFIKNWMLNLERNSPEFMGFSLTGLDPVVFGAVLIVVMIVMPTGLVRGLTDMAAASLRTLSKSRVRPE